jgi:peptidoglycan/LPS O-acetylase OafA/YrhL
MDHAKPIDSDTGHFTGSPPPNAPRERIVPLDGLRGIAILLVLLFHCIGNTSFPAAGGILYYLQHITLIGWTGVDLFFVLSGFLIGGILLAARDSAGYFQSFYARRVFRILPIYYLWIGIYFLVAFTPLAHWGAPLGIVRDKWTIIPVYGLFVQNLAWVRGPAFWSAWLSSLWTLAVEEQFYLLIPLLIRFLSRRAITNVLLLAIFGAPLLRILAFLFFADTHPSAPYILTPCRMDSLAMGVLLALVWRDEKSQAWIRKRIAWLCAITGLLFLGFLYFAVMDPSPYDFQMCAWGFSCIDAFFASLLLLVLAAPHGLWARICSVRFLTSLGGISYCIYIIHASILALCHSLLSTVPDGISTPSALLATLLALALTGLVAKISWRYLESPMIRIGHRFGFSPKTIAS